MPTFRHNMPEGFLDDETRTLVVPRKRKKAWAVLCDMLLEFDAVCKKHGLRYFAEGGTLLGAARHRGFIPWDDDMDVSMPRSDYDRLCEIGPAAFKHPYFFQTNATDPDSARGHVQIRNSETTAIMAFDTKDGKPVWKFNQGMFIDVFPFDNIPDDAEERVAFLAELQSIKDEIRKWKIVHAGYRLSEVGGVRSFLKYCRIRKARQREKRMGADMVAVLCEKLDATAKRYAGEKTEFRAPVAFKPHHREILPSRLFDQAPVRLPFEFFDVPAYRCYEEALRINYGPGWTEHVIGVNEHGGMILDPERPYTEYLPAQE